MSRFPFEPHDADPDDWADALSSAGTSADDMTFDILDDIDPALLTLSRPSPYRSAQWFDTTDSEDYHLDYPPFSCGADRAKFLIGKIAREYQAGLGADDQDAVHETADGKISLWDILEAIDQTEHDRLQAWRDRQS